MAEDKDLDLEKVKEEIKALPDEQFHEVYVELSKEVARRNKEHLGGSKEHKSTENV